MNNQTVISPVRLHEIEPATEGDMRQIFGWLKSEHRADGEGYWVNREMIAEAFEEGRVKVIRDGGEAVSFIWFSDYAPQVICVKQTHQRNRMGRDLLSWWVNEFSTDGLSYTDITIAPTEAVPFFEKFGFTVIGNEGLWPIARRTLGRSSLSSLMVSQHSDEGYRPLPSDDLIQEASELSLPERVCVDISTFDSDSDRHLTVMPAVRDEDGSFTLLLRAFRPHCHDDMYATVTVFDENGVASSYQANVRSKEAAEMGFVRGLQGDAYIENFTPIEKLKIEDASKRLASYKSLRNINNCAPLAA